MLFVRSNISTKLLLVDICFETFSVGLNFRKKKSLLGCSYNRTSTDTESHLNCLSKSIDANSLKHEDIILLGDFNSCTFDSSMKVFSETDKFRSFVKEANCFKIRENSSCIDLILTNKHLSFHGSCRK